MTNGASVPPCSRSVRRKTLGPPGALRGWELHIGLGKLTYTRMGSDIRASALTGTEPASARSHGSCSRRSCGHASWSSEHRGPSAATWRASGPTLLVCGQPALMFCIELPQGRKCSFLLTTRGCFSVAVLGLQRSHAKLIRPSHRFDARGWS
jgi:hypothetical protein